LDDLSLTKQQISPAFALCLQSDLVGIACNWIGYDTEFDLCKIGEFTRIQTLKLQPPISAPITTDNFENAWRKYPITPRILHTLCYHMMEDIQMKGSAKNFGTYPHERKNKDNKQHARSGNFKKNKSQEIIELEHVKLNTKALVRGIDLNGRVAGKEFIKCGYQQKFSYYTPLHDYLTDESTVDAKYEYGYEGTYEREQKEIQINNLRYALSKQI